MKTAEELLKEKGIKPETVHHNYAYVYRAVCGIIGEVQKEAYNRALEDATEKAKVSLFDWITDGFKEFKQNSNHYAINDGAFVKIDEQSILKLKK